MLRNNSIRRICNGAIEVRSRILKKPGCGDLLLLIFIESKLLVPNHIPKPTEIDGI